MKLIEILLEEEEKFDFSELDDLDDVIAKELQKAEDELEKRGELNEIGLVTAAMAAGMITRVALAVYRGMISTNGFELSKSNAKKRKSTSFLIQGLEKIENITDNAVKSVVRRFVKDSAKVDKITNVVKALGIVALIIASGDYGNPEGLSILKTAAGEIGPELVSAVKSADISKAALTVKDFLVNIAS